MDLTPYQSALVKANSVISSLLDKKRELLKACKELQESNYFDKIERSNPANQNKVESSSSKFLIGSTINQQEDLSDISKIVMALHDANNTISKLKEDIETLNRKCDKLSKMHSRCKNDELEINGNVPMKKNKGESTNWNHNIHQFGIPFDKLNEFYVNRNVVYNETDDSRHNRVIKINEDGKYLDPNIWYFRVNGKKKESRFDLLDNNKSVYRSNSISKNKIVRALLKCVKSDNISDISLALFSFSHNIVLNELLSLCKEIIDESLSNYTNNETIGADKVDVIKNIVFDAYNKINSYTLIIQSFIDYPHGHSYINNFVHLLHATIIGIVRNQVKHPPLHILYNYNIVKDEMRANIELDHGVDYKFESLHNNNQLIGTDDENYLNNFIIDLEDDPKEILDGIVPDIYDNADEDLLLYKNEVELNVVPITSQLFPILPNPDQVQDDSEQFNVNRDISASQTSVKIPNDVKNQLYLFIYTSFLCTVVTILPNFTSVLFKFITGLSLSVQSFGIEFNVSPLYGFLYSFVNGSASKQSKYWLLNIFQDDEFCLILNSMVSALTKRFDNLHNRDVDLETKFPGATFNANNILACLGHLSIELLNSYRSSDNANTLVGLMEDRINYSNFHHILLSIRESISSSFSSDESDLLPPRPMYVAMLINCRREGFYRVINSITTSSSILMCDPFSDIGLDFVKDEAEKIINLIEISKFTSNSTEKNFATKFISQDLPFIVPDANHFSQFMLEKSILDFYIKFWESKFITSDGLPEAAAVDIVASFMIVKILFESIYLTELDAGQGVILESKINEKLNQGRHYFKKMNISWYESQNRAQFIGIQSIQSFSCCTVSPDLLLDACIFLDSCIETLSIETFEESDKSYSKIKGVCTDLSLFVAIACIERMNFILLCSLRSLLTVLASCLTHRNEQSSLSARKVYLPIAHMAVQFMITTYSDFGLDVSCRADIIHEIFTIIMLFKSEERTREELHWISLQQKKLPIFVINLSRRYDRFHQIMKLCKEEGMIVIRYEAIDGKELIHSENKSQIPSTDVAVVWDSHLNCKFVTNTIRSKSILMTDTERACAASHLAVWRIIVDYRRNFLKSPMDKSMSIPLSIKDRGIMTMLKDIFKFTSIFNLNYEPVMITNALGKTDDWYFILEDDARLKTNRQRSKRFINQLVHNIIPIDFDVLFLGYFANSSMNINEFRKEKIKFRRINYVHGLHAYLIKGKSLEFILNQHLPITSPVDNYIGSLINGGHLNAYAVVEKVFTQQDKWKKSNILHSGRIS